MTRHPEISAVVDGLKADGIEVTWRVEALKAPGTIRADDHLLVHVVRSRHGTGATTAAVLGALLQVCTQVHID